MSPTPRDTYRQATYDAEESVFADTLFAEVVGLAGLAHLAQRLTDTRWWRDQVGVPLRVEPTRREAAHSYAVAWGRMRFDLDAERPHVLAHEAAHVATSALTGRLPAPAPEPAHGPRFRAVELDVVSLLFGADATRRLERAFEDRGLVVAGRNWPAAPAVEPRGLYGRWRIDRQGRSPTGPGTAARA